MDAYLPGMDETLSGIRDARVEATPEQMNEPEATAWNDGLQDSAGTIFDPSIHALKSDGTPSYTSTGKFRKKRGLNGTARPQQTSARLNFPFAAPSGENDLEGSAAAGASLAGMFIMCGIMAVGEDFKPESQAELEALTQKFQEYCDAKGIDDFPPGIALAIACGMYSVKRLAKPNVQSRVATFIGWTQYRVARVAGWIKGRFGYAQPNIRPDRVRENDVSKTPSSWRNFWRGTRSNS